MGTGTVSTSFFSSFFYYYLTAKYLNSDDMANILKSYINPELFFKFEL